MFWMPESPMFLLMKDRKEEALNVLRKMYSQNTRHSPYTYPVSCFHIPQHWQTTPLNFCFHSLNSLLVLVLLLYISELRSVFSYQSVEFLQFCNISS